VVITVGDVVQKVCNWFVEQICKSLEVQGREVLKHCKQSLPGYSDGSRQYQNVVRHMDSEDQVNKVSEGNEDSFENWTRSHSC
jgi:hypothetical protein